MMKQQRRYDRVMVLGMDGLDPRRVTRMVGDGELPAFARLQQKGALCALATSNPAESPVAWSSLATGCNPGKHGIFDFIHRNPSGYVPFLSLQRAKPTCAKGKDRYICPRHVPGFWRMTSDAQVPTTVIRWPVTFPAEPVNGRFLAGLGVPDVTGRLGKHTFYTTADRNTDHENVVQVAWREDAITTSLFGPTMTGMSGMRPVRAKLTIERTECGITLRVGSQQQRINPGTWSDWFTVRFKWGPIHICDALVKFHLVSATPELRMLATPLQIDPRKQAWPLTQPASYGVELTDQVGLFHTLGIPEDTNAVNDGRYDLDAFLQQTVEIDRQRRAMFDYELNRFSEGVFAFVFDAGDRIQHMFWCVDDETSPTFDPAKAKKYGHVIRDLYRNMDDVLAAALDTADEDTAVFVVSDHGFAPFHRAVHVNRWLIEEGFMKLKRGGEGRSLLADVDWDRTQAYALGFTGIYLNIADRESHGIVRKGEEAENVINRLAEGLRRARDPDSGARTVRDVYLTRQVYSGPHKGDGPDLLVGFEPEYRASWQTALGGAPEGVVVDNDKPWAADHLVDPTAVPGVLAANVPITCGAPAGIDLAPTVLDCLGLPAPSNMDGKSWLGDSARQQAVHESPDVREAELVCATSSPPGQDGLDDQQRAQLEHHLSDLGYL